MLNHGLGYFMRNRMEIALILLNKKMRHIAIDVLLKSDKDWPI